MNQGLIQLKIANCSGYQHNMATLKAPKAKVTMRDNDTMSIS